MNCIDDFFLSNLAKEKYYSIIEEFKFNKNFKNFPIVSYAYDNIIQLLRPKTDYTYGHIYKDHPGENTIGITILDNIEYIYAYSNILKNDLINVNHIKKDSYENIYSDVDNYSNYSNQSYDNNQNNDIDYYFLASNEQENKVNNYFKKFKMLNNLPNYFFLLKNKNRDKIKDPNEIKNYKNYFDSKGNNIEEKKEIIKLEDVVNNLFSTFIETDEVFYYKDDIPLTLIEEGNKSFSVSNKIEISEYGANINIIKSKLLNIEKNSIILIEDKLSAPKFYENLLYKKDYIKQDFYSSLNFLVYKIISKIKIYKEFIKSELNDNDNFKFILLLVYNNKPIKEDDMENVIKKIINNLYHLNLVKEKLFDFQVLYILPNISMNYFLEIENQKNEINKLKSDYNELANKYNEINSKYSNIMDILEKFKKNN